MVITNKRNRKFINFTPTSKYDNCYVICSIVLNPKETLALPSVYVADYQTWHQHVGCMSEYAFWHLPDSMRNFPHMKILSTIPICPGCAQGKMTLKSFSNFMSQAAMNFKLIHLDLKELPVPSYHKYKYFVVFLDDQSRFIFTFNLHQKSDTLEAIKNFKKYVRI